VFIFGPRVALTTKKVRTKRRELLYYGQLGHLSSNLKIHQLNHLKIKLRKNIREQEEEAKRAKFLLSSTSKIYSGHEINHHNKDYVIAIIVLWVVII
jgi:hypothetical protein